MQIKHKQNILALALLSSLGIAAPAAHAEGALSANVGFVSDYIFRGIAQSDSSASAGLDYENSGFYLGTWFADVDLGLEVDLYGGYGGEFSGVSYGLGFTTYRYTSDKPDSPAATDGAFDDTYNEYNVSLGYGPVSVAYAGGTHDNFEGKVAGNKEVDYSVTTVTAEHNGFYALVGDYGKDSKGSWYELGYGTELGGFDAGVSLISSDKDLDNQEYLVFSLGKSFDL